MHQLLDYDLYFEGVPIFCDNKSVISLSKYSLHHSKAKHIDIKHHFIHDHVEYGDFVLEIFDYEKILLENLYLGNIFFPSRLPWHYTL